MVKSFEDLTKKLSDQERRLVKETVRILRLSLGKASAIKNQEIASELETRTGIKIKGVRVRKIINEIRVLNLLPGLIAGPRGYYVASDEAEFLDYIQSLDDRLNAIKAVLRSLEDQFTEKYDKIVVRYLGEDTEESKVVAVDKADFPSPMSEECLAYEGKN